MKMKKVTRWLALLLAAVMTCSLLAGCGKKKDSGKDSDSSKTESADKGESSEGLGGTKKITFWCGYSSNHFKPTQELVKRFNQSQSKYRVEIMNRGSTGEMRTSLLGMNKKSYPSLITGTPLTIAQYADLNFIAMLQPYLDADPDKWTEDFYDVVRTSYCDRDGNMVGSPIGVSMTGYGVNMSVLKKMGYTEEQVRSFSFEKIAQVATEAVKQKSTTGITYGLTSSGGADLHDMLRIQGIDIVDNENGFKAFPTKSLINEGNTKAYIEKYAKIIQQLSRDKVLHKSLNINDLGSEFRAGKILFWKNTNSYFYDAVITGTKPGFEYTFIPTPGLDDSAKFKGQCLSEGTGMFICNTGDKEEMQGAYEFIKFCAKTESQEYWCTHNSYVPYTKAAAASTVIQDWQNKNFPSGKIVNDVLLNTSKDCTGTYAPLGDELLNALGDVISSLITDPDSDINTTIENADYRLNVAITTYAKRLKTSGRK